MVRIEEINPHGMCAGVRAAVDLAMRHKGAYCLHSLVHNEIITGELKALKKGAATIVARTETGLKAKCKVKVKKAPKKVTLKPVNGMLSGTHFSTVWNAWLSVTTNFGAG